MTDKYTLIKRNGIVRMYNTEKEETITKHGAITLLNAQDEIIRDLKEVVIKSLAKGLLVKHDKISELEDYRKLVEQTLKSMYSAEDGFKKDIIAGIAEELGMEL